MDIEELSDRIKSDMHALIVLSTTDDDALKLLVDVTNTAATVLSYNTEKHRLRPIARQQSDWPMIVTPDTKTEDIRRLTESIELGAGVGFNFDKDTRRASFDVPETEVAYALWHCLESARRNPNWQVPNFVFGMRFGLASHDPKKLQELPEEVSNRDEIPVRYRQNPEELPALAKALPPLRRVGRDLDPRWKEAVKKALPRIFGENFEVHPVFDHWWKNERSLSRGQIRDEIRKKVLQSFRSLAPK